MTAELIVHDKRAQRDIQPVQRDVTPMDLLRVATSQGADLDRLEKLMDLQRRWEADHARKAYAAAMAAFKADPPQIVKNKHVQFATKAGDRMDYWHATHDEVCGKIAAALAKHGLSHSWRMRQADGLIHVTCRIMHELGHSEEFELFGSPDTSGLKSPLQAIASTTTFLQRYTLLGGTGLSTAEMREADDDAGKKKAQEPEPEGFAEWRDNLNAIPEDQLPQVDLQASWKKASPEIRRYVIKYCEDWWHGLRDKAKGKP
jgi:hypothetical protein